VVSKQGAWKAASELASASHRGCMQASCVQVCIMHGCHIITPATKRPLRWLCARILLVLFLPLLLDMV
jgi:hypothetical protein